MKIAIIGPAYPYRGGIANFSERLAAEFQTSGDDVELFTFKMMYPDFLFPGKSQYATTPLQFPIKINRVINSVNPFNWWKIGKSISQQNFDIVLIAYSIPFLSPCLSTIARQIKKNKTTKIISIIHNLHPHEKRIGDKFLSKMFLKSCDAHLTLSQKVSQDITTFLPQATVVNSTHPNYDTFGKIIEKNKAKQLLNIDINKKYILFFGLIRKYKGLDLLIMAMPKIVSELKNVQLIIAGEFYEDYNNYQKLIDDLNITDSIIIKNQFIPEDEVNQYFCAADVVVQPYKNATQSGITQICYHFNKPMIVTNVGGLPENVPHDKVGLVCEPNEISIADAIIKFYKENKENTYIDFILEEKKKYSWINLVELIKNQQ